MITIQLTNKWLYTFIAISMLIFVFSVYAYTSIPNPGHGGDTVWVDVEGEEMTLQDALDRRLIGSPQAGDGIDVDIREVSVNTSFIATRQYVDALFADIGNSIITDFPDAIICDHTSSHRNEDSSHTGQYIMYVSHTGFQQGGFVWFVGSTEAYNYVEYKSLAGKSIRFDVSNGHYKTSTSSTYTTRRCTRSGCTTITHNIPLSCQHNIDSFEQFFFS